MPMIEADTILPSQLIDRARIQSGEQRLRLAVLEDAFDCLKLRHTVHKVYARAMDRADAIQWFTSDDVSRPFSFLPICDILGFDADAIRERLVRLGFRMEGSMKVREEGCWGPTVTGVKTSRVLHRKRQSRWHGV